MSRNGKMTSRDRTLRPQAGAMAPPRSSSRAGRLAPGIIGGVCALCGIGLTGGPVAFARRPAITCPEISVRSVSASWTVVERGRVSHPGPTVDVTYVHASKAGVRARTGWVDIIAVGPVLGSMDSSAVRIDSACTSKGVVLTATITRSAHYTGAALQNVIWRPRIEVLARLREPEASFRVTWRMRLTNGTEVGRARTPTYPAQSYPATVAREIHRHGARRSGGHGIAWSG